MPTPPRSIGATAPRQPAPWPVRTAPSPSRAGTPIRKATTRCRWPSATRKGRLAPSRALPRSAVFSPAIDIHRLGISEQRPECDAGPVHGVDQLGRRHHDGWNDFSVGPQTYSVGAIHDYAQSGTQTLTVSVAGPQNESITTSQTISVAPAPIAAFNTTFVAQQGVGLDAQLGVIVDPNLSDTSSDFVVTANFGDGTSPVTATVTGSNGLFNIDPTHTYANAGTYNVLVSISKSINGAARLVKILDDTAIAYVNAQAQELPAPTTQNVPISDWIADIKARKIPDERKKQLLESLDVVFAQTVENLSLVKQPAIQITKKNDALEATFATNFRFYSTKEYAKEYDVMQTFTAQLFEVGKGIQPKLLQTQKLGEIFQLGRMAVRRSIHICFRSRPEICPIRSR